MSDFVRYVDLKKAPVITLKGFISPKRVPSGVMMQELDVDPPEISVSVKDLLYAGNWKMLVKDEFALPPEASEGEIRPTQNGRLYQGIQDSWVLIGSAIARQK